MGMPRRHRDGAEDEHPGVHRVGHLYAVGGPAMGNSGLLWRRRRRRGGGCHLSGRRRWRGRRGRRCWRTHGRAVLGRANRRQPGSCDRCRCPRRIYQRNKCPIRRQYDVRRHSGDSARRPRRDDILECKFRLCRRTCCSGEQQRLDINFGICRKQRTLRRREQRRPFLGRALRPSSNI